MLDLRSWGPATALIVVIVTLVVAVGGAVVIVHPETLTFRQYLDDLKTFALAVAGLASARALHSAGTRLADARKPADAIYLPRTGLAPVVQTTSGGEGGYSITEVRDEEPGDSDALPNLPTTPADQIPTDTGDAGQAFVRGGA